MAKATKLKRSKQKGWAERWSEGTEAIEIKKIDAVAKPEYVAWIDLMGAKTWMAGSIRRAAEIIGLIHVAGLRAASDHEMRAYPVIDGVYLVGENKALFQRATGAAMRTLVQTFSSRKPADRFLVRGGIAYGRVLHGDSLTDLHDDLKKAERYSTCLALGISIGQAYSAEGKAPPFGFYVDMTARSTASGNDSPYLSSFYRWWSATRQEEVRIANEFGHQLMEHFNYLRFKHREIEYPKDRLEEHLALAREYFRVPSESH